MTEFSSFSRPKGVPDYVPPESAAFVAVRSGLLDAARRAGFPTSSYRSSRTPPCLPGGWGSPPTW